ncbi:MAG: HAD family phosphatase [Chitinophagaceae bacterium]|nr:MAG: HAD family phosphatase [Chitinophagaceae bacterium]
MIIIWDLGNVLVDWSPRYLCDKLFDDASERDWFLSHVCTMEWHNAVDAGGSTEDSTSALVAAHPDWAEQIRAYYGRWKEMFAGPIDGSVEILERLHAAGHRQFALSNWSATLFEETRADFPFLKCFEGIVLSGAEQQTKPQPGIYQRLIERYALNPAQCIFIDDRATNVETATRLGMDGIVFESPETLNRELRQRGIA